MSQELETPFIISVAYAITQGKSNIKNKTSKSQNENNMRMVYSY